MNKKDIGEKLKHLRKKDNLSMEKLANIFNDKFNTNISKSMISSWETGRHLISYENLNLYCDYFDVPFIYFINEDYEPEDLGIEKAKINLNWIEKKISIAVDKANKNIPNNEDIFDNVMNNMTDEIVENLNKLNLIGLNKVRVYLDDLLEIDDYVENTENGKE